MNIDEELTGLYFLACRAPVVTHFSVLILCTIYNKLNKSEGDAVNQTFHCTVHPYPPPLQTEMTSAGMYGSAHRLENRVGQN